MFNSSNRPSPNAALFITVIVRLPIVQIFTMLLAMTILAIELPVPAIKKYSLYRSLVVRIVLLLFQVSLTILFYQVRPSIFDLTLPSPLSNCFLGHQCSHMVPHIGCVLWTCCNAWRRNGGSKAKSWQRRRSLMPRCYQSVFWTRDFLQGSMGEEKEF